MLTLLACPAAALVGRAAAPQMNLDAAKEAWLAKLESPQWGQTRDGAPAATAVSEDAAKEAWLNKLEAPTWGGGAKAYPNMPPSVHPGVLTGQAVFDLLNDAKARGYAIPAVNCVTSSSVNACLEAAAKADAPVMIQFSSGGSPASDLMS